LKYDFYLSATSVTLRMIGLSLNELRYFIPKKVK